MTDKNKPTSHDYADSCERLAAFLKSQPAFELPETEAIAQLYLYWPDKHHFLALVRAIHGGKKEYVTESWSGKPETEILYTVTLPSGERVRAKIRQSNICRLVRPAIPAQYECEPFLSQEEESEMAVEE